MYCFEKKDSVRLKENYLKLEEMLAMSLDLVKEKKDMLPLC